MKHVIYNCLIAFVMICVCAACTSNKKSESALDGLIGKYDLPSDLDQALAVIDTMYGYERKEAFMQLAVENPLVYDWDVDFEKYSDFPTYYSPLDKSFRIYSYDYGMHDTPQILQYKNSKGKVLTYVLSTYPLEKLEKWETPTADDYDDQYANYSEHLATVEIDGTPTHIMKLVVNTEGLEPRDDDTLAYITGMQLTDEGYKYVPIFKDIALFSIPYKLDSDIDRIKGVYDGSLAIEHNDAWYRDSDKTLGIPLSCVNSAELFCLYRWNDEVQRFDIVNVLGNDIHPEVSQKLGYNYGMELIMCFPDLIVRIDCVTPPHYMDRSFKYSAWSNGKSMDMDPDIIIYGGVEDKRNGTITFTNEDYEYIVPCADNKYNNTLVIKKNGKVVKTIEASLEENEEYPANK